MRRQPEPGVAAAPNAIDFYFDFASPYGFIAAIQIEAIERAVKWRPFLLGAVYKMFGQSPLDNPLKRNYVIEVDAPRVARRLLLELKIPANFPWLEGSATSDGAVAADAAACLPDKVPFDP